MPGTFNMNQTHTIYVVGFVTDNDSDGYEWSYDHAPVATKQEEWISAGDADVSNVQEVDLDQLALVTGDTTEESITDALSEASHLWTPDYGQNRQAA